MMPLSCSPVAEFVNWNCNRPFAKRKNGITSGNTGNACDDTPATAPIGVSCGVGSLLLIHSYCGEIDLIRISTSGLSKFTEKPQIKLSAFTSVVKTGGTFSLAVPVNGIT